MGKKEEDKSQELYDLLSQQETNRFSPKQLKKILEKEKRELKEETYFKTLQKEKGLKGKILDIGCGYGRCMYFLGIQKYTGTDISEGFLKLGRKIFPSAKFIKMDARKLNFKENSFDTIFMFETIEHIPNYNLALKEVYRVLKKEGSFIITTPNKLKWLLFPIYYILPAKSRPWGLYLIGTISKKEKETYIKDLEVEEKIGQKEHVKMFSPNELAKALKKEGFTIQSINKYRTCLDGRVSKKFIDSKFYQNFLKKILPCESIMIVCSK